MDKFIIFTEELLSKQHLATVREIGRRIGVKAPAASKKDQLIEEILAIQSGKKEAVPPSKRGAPPKIKVDISAFLVKDDYVIPNDYPLPENTPYKNQSEFATGELHDSIKSTKLTAEGVLELCGNYGFLRVNNYENSSDDIYVSIQNIRKYNLKKGDKIKATAVYLRENESPAMQTAITINGLSPEKIEDRKDFDKITPCYPCERLVMETQDNDAGMRCIDLFCPIGKGQRGLIVAPPKTGKTTLLKKIALSIEKNNPEVKLIILLVDERPEEVTDIKRAVKAEVVSSTFDEGSAHHVKIADLVINRARRLAELGTDVVILMDSITRLTRAYNSQEESSGKILSGGLDPLALQAPKKFFGSARNLEEGGSLTIISTALIQTGSRMDDVIFEEFKGTGNMEIHLSDKLSEKRIFPAIDLLKSGTRKDDLLLTEEELSAVYKLRNFVANRQDATEVIIDMIKRTKNNADLISKIDGWIKAYNN